MSANEHIHAMYEAVWAAPLALDRRLVLADALLEAGDPRGEFIALQFETSARARKRAQKLLLRHRRAFLGQLRGVVVDGTEAWQHGFVVAAHARLSGDQADLKAWATVERLVGHLVTGHEPKELASPNLRNLRQLELIPEPVDRCAPYFVRDARAEASLERARRWLAKARRQHVLRRGAEWFRG